MSLILDALNRSRDEADPVPNLATHHPIEVPPARLSQYVPWLGLALALLVIVVLVVRLTVYSVDEQEKIAAPVMELTQNIGSAANAVTSELKARAEASRISAATPVQTAETSVEPRAVSTTAEPIQAKSIIKTSTVPVDSPDPAIAQLYRDKDKLQASVQPSAVSTSPGPQKNQVVEEEMIDIEGVLERAQREMGNADLADHPAPFLGSLSQRAKDEVPTIYYQKHDYSSNAGVSSVTLNGKTVKVGGSPSSGLTVDEILADSVILTYRGSQFRLRALNSWVNL